MNTRANQSGSVVSFVVVGLVLVIGAAGLLYFIGHRSAGPVIAGPEVSVPAPETTTPPRTDTPNSSSSDGNEGESNESNKDAPTSNEPKPTLSDDRDQPPVETPQELSETGPAETFGTLIVLGLVSGASVAYVRSRAAAASL